MPKLIPIAFFWLAGLVAVVWAQSNATSPTTQPDQRSVEERIRAIETYLKIDAKPTDPVPANAQTIEELRAAMIRLERQQDLLTLRLRELSTEHTRPGNSSDTDVRNLEKTVSQHSGAIRDLSDRVRRLETRY